MVIKKFNRSESAQKIHASRDWCQHTCTPILVGVTSPVSEILLLSKTAKFPFRPMDYSPWSSKNLIDRNRLKKFMQVGLMSTYMHTNFGGRDLSGFGDTATSKTAKFPFRPMDYSPWSSKNLIDRNRLKKFMQVGIDVNIHAHQFWWVWPLWFRRYCYFQKRPNFPFDPWTIVHGHQKI